MADTTDSMRVALIRGTLRAREYSLSPISSFAVGAALLGGDRTICHGCSIEYAGLMPNNRAERAAFFKAVGESCSKFRAIVIVGGSKGKPLADYYPPCGACRQLMAQFCSLGTFKVIMAVDETDWKECTLGELLPMAFRGFNPNV